MCLSNPLMVEMAIHPNHAEGAHEEYDTHPNSNTAGTIVGHPLAAAIICFLGCQIWHQPNPFCISTARPLQSHLR